MAWWSGVRRWLREVFDPLPTLDPVQERQLARVEGAEPINALADRRRARVTGVIRSIAIGPRGPSATFEVELSDGSGELKAIWLGQRQILGLEPGRQLICQGLVAMDGGVRVMRDPYYELVPIGSAK
ncbi:MAG: OB-fold nucleic acid binding domain-containing protein [Bifidobacteriaceae bacterium]|jgi:hypothetical protein|nr:OB-fold nucleic acid binding domain-containing protein [Bifidobacteriaceae bacterium]